MSVVAPFRRTRPALGTAFGLGIESETPIPGLPRTDAMSRQGARVRIDLEASEAGPEATESVMAKRAPDGRLVASLDLLSTGEHRLFAAGFGSFDVAPDGSRVVCRPEPGAATWVWQRFLLGQALPFAAVLHGIEPFHAAGVVAGDGVLAIAGRSGSGKSSLALELASRGMRFFADDVVGIAPDGTCAPGPAVANVRDSSLRRRAESGCPPFDAVIGRTDESIRALVEVEGRSLPLRAIYFLDRRPDHRRVSFEATLDPFLLLAHTFNVLVRTPERLERQLDICSRLAPAVPHVCVRAPEWVPAGELAALIALHQNAH
jgi:hypothetical protein